MGQLIVDSFGDRRRMAVMVRVCLQHPQFTPDDVVRALAELNISNIQDVDLVANQVVTHLVPEESQQPPLM